MYIPLSFRPGTQRRYIAVPRRRLSLDAGGEERERYYVCSTQSVKSLSLRVPEEQAEPIAEGVKRRGFLLKSEACSLRPGLGPRRSWPWISAAARIRTWEPLRD
jgi:hypothetical protein